MRTLYNPWYKSVSTYKNNQNDLIHMGNTPNLEIIPPPNEDFTSPIKNDDTPPDRTIIKRNKFVEETIILALLLLFADGIFQTMKAIPENPFLFNE